MAGLNYRTADGIRSEVVYFHETSSLPWEERLKRTMSSATAWKGKIDGEKLKREIYEARRVGSRPPPNE